jgi:hypothetical protein
MKPNTILHSNRALQRFLPCLAFVSLVSLHAQVFTWNRQAYGQPYLICPLGSGGYATNYYPNNSAWSQVIHTGSDCEGHTNAVIDQPSNWSPAGTEYPDGPGVDVVLGAPAPTTLDVVVALNRLTIQNGGNLAIWAGSITANAFDFQSDGGLTNLYGPGSTLNLRSGGTLTKSAGMGLFLLKDMMFYATNTTFTVNSGTLDLPAYSRLFGGGTFVVSSGAVLDLARDTPNATHLQGVFSGTGTGTVRLANGGWLYGGSGGATLNLPGNMFQWTGGIIEGSYYNGNPMANSGTMTVHVINGATLNDGPAFDGCDLINTGTVNEQDSGSLLVYASVIHNEAGGIFDLQTDNGTSSGTVVNAGLFKKSGGSGTSAINSAFNSMGGTIEVDSGNLALLYGGTSSNGTFVVAGGSTINLASTNNGSTMNGLFTGSGAGTVLVDNGTITTGSGSATFNLPGNMFQWNGGTIQSGSDYFTNAGTIHIGGPVTLYSGVNRGTLVQGGGNLTLGGTLYNEAGGVYEFQSDTGIVNANSVLYNAGTLRKTGGTGTSTIGAYTIYNTGTLQADIGTLAFTGGSFNQNAGTLTLNGTSLDFQTKLNLNGGVLTGSGTSGTVGSVWDNIGGAVSPGAPLGTITVSGTYFQRSGGTLNIELGGRNPGQFDQLNVTGSAYPGGTLNVTLVNGFKPTPGDQFQILSCAARGGYGFDTLNVPPGISVTYSNNGVYLVATETAPVKLLAPQMSGSDFKFSFATINGQSYTIQQNTNLATTNWADYTNFTGDGSLLEFATPAAGIPQRFFRVRQP